MDPLPCSSLACSLVRCYGEHNCTGPVVVRRGNWRSDNFESDTDDEEYCLRNVRTIVQYYNSLHPHDTMGTVRSNRR